MEHNTDRILWTVLVLALGVALFVVFKGPVTDLLTQVVGKIKDTVTAVNVPDVTPPTPGAIFLPFF